MSGHSKWSTIKRKKEKTDSQRAKIFTKIGREISVSVRASGPDPSSNSKLKELISKAKSYNVPSDNIQRIIKKAEGTQKDNYESITYEGYGPGGTPMIVETLTDNRNRTAANIRYYFDKYGGNLGNIGCVAYLFSRSGVISMHVGSKSEEEVMEDVFECGGEDFDMYEDMAQVVTSPEAFAPVRDALEQKGYTFINAEIEMLASTQTILSDENEMKNMAVLLNMLEDDDDVQNIWHNLENEHELDR